MKKICKFSVGFLAFGLLMFSNFAFSQDESLEPAPGAGSGCTFKLAGIEFPCTRIWCSSTMSFKACGIGDALSQPCSVSRGC
jgi:hypothetical protein